KDFLRQILQVLPAARQPQQRAKDKSLVLPNQLFELKLGLQSRCKTAFSSKSFTPAHETSTGLRSLSPHIRNCYTRTPCTGPSAPSSSPSEPSPWLSASSSPSTSPTTTPAACKARSGWPPSPRACRCPNPPPSPSPSSTHA